MIFSVQFIKLHIAGGNMCKLSIINYLKVVFIDDILIYFHSSTLRSIHIGLFVFFSKISKYFSFFSISVHFGDSTLQQNAMLVQVALFWRSYFFHAPSTQPSQVDSNQPSSLFSFIVIMVFSFI